MSTGSALVCSRSLPLVLSRFCGEYRCASCLGAHRVGATNPGSPGNASNGGGVDEWERVPGCACRRSSAVGRQRVDILASRCGDAGGARPADVGRRSLSHLLVRAPDRPPGRVEVSPPDRQSYLVRFSLSGCLVTLRASTALSSKRAASCSASPGERVTPNSTRRSPSAALLIAVTCTVSSMP